MKEKSNSGVHLAELIQKDFKLSEDEFDIDYSDHAALKERLRVILSNMLDNDFQGLLNAMYRLDIDEAKFKQVITGQEGSDISGILARMIIDREMEKVKTRIRYSQKYPND